nr:hypothetical protein [uncultured Sphingomonas sp.]
MAGNPVPSRIGHEVECIAIGQSARILPVTETLGDGIAGLAARGCQLLGVHRAFEPHMQPGDFALCDRVQTHAKEQAALEDHRGLRLAARQPVQFICQNEIDLAPFDRRQQCFHSGP